MNSNKLNLNATFGSPMPTRTWSDPNAKYKYGFNTQEKDDEIAGEGNINTALFWEYDTRIGRRWNLDPISQINLSDYCVFANNPIFYVDFQGNTIGKGKEFLDDYKSKVNERKTCLEGQKSKLESRLLKTTNEKKKAVLTEQINSFKTKIEKLTQIVSEITDLENSTNTYDLVSGGRGYKRGAGNTEYDPSSNHIVINFGDECAMAHELKHAHQALQGFASFPKIGESLGYLMDIFDEVEAHQRSMFYSELFEDDADQLSFKNGFVKKTGGSDVNAASVMKYINGNGKYTLIPQIQLNSSSLVKDLLVDDAVKKIHGNKTYEEWQKMKKLEHEYKESFKEN